MEHIGLTYGLHRKDSGSFHRIIQNTEWRLPRKREFGKDWIRFFGDSLLNQSWVYTQSWVSSTLGIFCVHATWKFWRLAYELIVRLAARFTPDGAQSTMFGLDINTPLGVSVFHWWQQWWLLCKADVENLFSILLKVHTEARHSLHADTITAYIQCMLNIDSCCYELNVSDEMLKLAKSATYSVIAMHMIFHPL